MCALGARCALGGARWAAAARNVAALLTPLRAGADVTHPTGFDASEPSIAAVTASYECAAPRPRAPAPPAPPAPGCAAPADPHIRPARAAGPPPKLAHAPPPPPARPRRSASLGRFACRVLQQGHRQEIITGLQGAAKALLLNFYSRTQARGAGGWGGGGGGRWLRARV